jgi:antitoxin component HigA of HigAB toxin-antitoxin module
MEIAAKVAKEAATPVVSNPSEYQDALEELTKLMEDNPPPKSKESKRLRELARALEDYELIYFPLTS